jgi:hypothetical protein
VASAPVEAAVEVVAADLRESGAKFAVVGALAVSARTEPRFTRDADFAVDVSDDDAAEQLIYALRSRGYQVFASVEQQKAGRLATIRLTSPVSREVVVDLLFASSGIEPEVVADATLEKVFPRLSLPVAKTGHLLAMKTLSRAPSRMQDDVDLVGLLAIATEADLEIATRALSLISARGYARKKNLRAEWKRVLAEMRFPKEKAP